VQTIVVQIKFELMQRVNAYAEQIHATIL
jgi:hypothetical protein